MFKSEAAHDIRHYVGVGQNWMANIEQCLLLAGMSFDGVQACLDFPSGYGRVLRHLCARLGADRITASDVDAQAVRFCVAEFGVRGYVAQRQIGAVRFPGRYDLIVAGSLLTHLPPDAGTAALSAIVASLRDPGLVLFTSQGISCLDHLNWYGREFASAERRLRAEVAATGVGFVPYRHARDWGIAIHAEAYVRQLMATHFGDRVRIVRFADRGIDGHQDLWAYRTGESN